jgi:hypothetical protein
LRQEKKKLDQLKIKVIVITFEPERLITLPPAEAAEDFPYYVDKGRQLYRYYGFLKAGFWDLWGPPTWLSYLRLLLKGRKIMKSESDIYQRGGDVLIDQRGMIRFHHIGAGPADRPDLDVIFNLVENRL